MKIRTLLAGIIISIASFTGCAIIDTGDNKDAIEALAKAAVSQAVYSSLVEKPELEPIYLKVEEVLKKIDTSVEMTPNEIAEYIIKEITPLIKGDYTLIIDGVIEAFFTKYNIGWSDRLTKEDLHRYIGDIIESIDTGIKTYHDR